MKEQDKVSVLRRELGVVNGKLQSQKTVENQLRKRIVDLEDEVKRLKSLVEKGQK